MFRKEVQAMQTENKHCHTFSKNSYHAIIKNLLTTLLHSVHSKNLAQFKLDIKNSRKIA